MFHWCVASTHSVTGLLFFLLLSMPDHWEWCLMILPGGLPRAEVHCSCPERVCERAWRAPTLCATSLRCAVGCPSVVSFEWSGLSCYPRGSPEVPAWWCLGVAPAVAALVRLRCLGLWMGPCLSGSWPSAMAGNGVSECGSCQSWARVCWVSPVLASANHAPLSLWLSRPSGLWRHPVPGPMAPIGRTLSESACVSFMLTLCTRFACPGLAGALLHCL